MQEYLRRLWAAVTFSEERLPLLGRRGEARETDDLESCVQGGGVAVVGERVVAGEPAEVRVQVSPFSEEHFLCEPAEVRVQVRPFSEEHFL